MIGLDWAGIQRLDETRWLALCSYLETRLLADGETEVTITKLRAELLALVNDGLRDAPRLIELLSALAIFCTDAEFVFAESVKETDLVERLRANRSVAEFLCLRCYRKVDTDDLPIADVERLGSITDETSLAVQTMYEENPYPRWKKLPTMKTNDGEIDILVAGCGSGRHVLGVAAGSPKSRVVGIDLSLHNLAYGLTKAREYGIENVRLIHGDMYEIGALGLTFDAISAVGSLHHVKEPLRALQVLRSVLRSSGTIKLGLYSATGRAASLAAIALRSELDIPATTEGIREFRQMLWQLPADHPAKGVTKSPDFYSISGCRDLFFHVQEHNFDVSKLFDFIEHSGMRLVGFTIPDRLKGLAEPTRESLMALERNYPWFAGSMFRIMLAD